MLGFHKALVFLFTTIFFLQVDHLAHAAKNDMDGVKTKEVIACEQGVENLGRNLTRAMVPANSLAVAEIVSGLTPLDLVALENHLGLFLRVIEFDPKLLARTISLLKERANSRLKVLLVDVAEKILVRLSYVHDAEMIDDLSLAFTEVLTEIQKQLMRGETAQADEFVRMIQSLFLNQMEQGAGLYFQKLYSEARGDGGSSLAAFLELHQILVKQAKVVPQYLGVADLVFVSYLRAQTNLLNRAIGSFRYTEIETLARDFALVIEAHRNALLGAPVPVTTGFPLSYGLDFGSLVARSRAIDDRTTLPSFATFVAAIRGKLTPEGERIFSVQLPKAKRASR